MQTGKLSDLPYSSVSGQIELFQPQSTLGCLATAGPRLDRKRMTQAFEDAFHCEGLRHVRSFQWDYSKDENGGPFALGAECGGNLRIVDSKTLEWFKSEKSANTIALTCTNPNCGMALRSGSYRTKESLSNLMLHMMLKQMAPELKTLNFADCSQRQRPLIQGNLEEAHRIGLISVAHQEFWGNIKRTSPNALTEGLYCLGFTLMMGLKTADDCDGQDQWLRFLLEKKFEALHKHHDASSSILFGPK
jgi:hypothetical protein